MVTPLARPLTILAAATAAGACLGFGIGCLTLAWKG